MSLNYSSQRQKRHSVNESQAEEQALAAVLPVGLFQTDDQGRYRFVNPCWCQLTGMLPEAAEGEGWLNTVHSGDRQQISTAWEQAWQHQAPFQAEYRLQHPSGKVVWVLSQATFTAQYGSAIAGYVGTLTDITAYKQVTASESAPSQDQPQQPTQRRSSERANRQQAEAVLTEFRDFYLTLFESFPTPIWRSGSDGNANYFNQAWLEFTGRSLPQELGVGWLEGVHPEDRDKFNKTYFRAFRDREPFELEYRLHHRDGTYHWILDCGRPFHDFDLRFAGYIGTCYDITERKQAEAILRENEAKLRLTLEAAKMGSWDWNLLSNEISLSGDLEPILGVPQGSSPLKYEAFLELVHPDDRDYVHQAISQAAEAGGNYSVDFRSVWPDGSSHWIDSKGQVYCDAQGQPIRLLGVATDITARKQTEAALQQQAERERLIAETTQRIRQSLDLDAILNTTVAEVRSLLQTDRVSIYRFWPDGTGMVTTEAVVAEQMTLLGQTFPNNLFPQTTLQHYQQGQIDVIGDIQTIEVDPALAAIIQLCAMRAILVVPILQGTERGTELWGLLLTHQCHQPRHWQPFEVELLQQLAGQVAIAIQQSELYQQVHRLNSDLEQQVQKRTAQLQQAFEFEASLKRITDKVRDSLDENQILQTAVQELASAIGVISCNASLYDLERRTSTICYEYTALETLFLGRVVQMSNFPEGYEQLLEGQYFQFCSIVPNPVRGRVTMLACPIVEEQGVLGDLWLTHHQSYAFTQQDIRLVQQVANQCAIAIRQARLYQAVQIQVQELERLNHLKDDFLSTVSHELRTPMSNIKMATQMLEVVLKQMGALSPDHSKAVRYFEILNQECQRETNLINDLLDLSRLKTGTELSLTTIETHPWLISLIAPFQERAQSQQQQLRLSISKSLPSVTTESDSLGRIVTELLNNACKYTPAQEIITVSARATRQLLRLSISNSGVEIPAHELTRIFDKFYRVPNNDPWRHGGTGLGLALVQKLVERLGATIDVTSTDGQTQFTVHLPLNIER